MLSMRGYPSTRVPTSPRQPCSTDSATSADSPPTTGNASESHRTRRRSVGVALSPDCDIAASVHAERYGVATAGMSLASTTGLRAAGSAGWAAANQSCRSEEHTSELQSLMRISYAVFCLKKKKQNIKDENIFTTQR